jgi:hypothetical protein
MRITGAKAVASILRSAVAVRTVAACLAVAMLLAGCHRKTREVTSEPENQDLVNAGSVERQSQCDATHGPTVHSLVTWAEAGMVRVVRSGVLPCVPADSKQALSLLLATGPSGNQERDDLVLFPQNRLEQWLDESGLKPDANHIVITAKYYHILFLSSEHEGYWHGAAIERATGRWAVWTILD